MEINRFSPEDPKIQNFIFEQQAEFANRMTIVTEPILGENQSPESVFNTLKQARANLLDSLFTEELQRLQNSQFIEFFDEESIAEIVGYEPPDDEYEQPFSFYNQKERDSAIIVHKCQLMCRREFSQISNEFIEFVSSILKTRIAEYTHKSETLKEYFDLLQQKLGRTIPLSSIEANKRLAGIQFILFDPLATNDSRPFQKTDKKQVYLPYDFSLADLAHELTHILSGQTWQEKTEVNNSGGKKQELRSTRTGLLFEPDSSGVENFTWLNEALTESITREWIGNSETPEYATEIQLLEKVINWGGISIPQAREAYFENFNPNDTHRTTKIADFFQITNKSFGPGFLINLSYFIEYNNTKATGSGVKAALQKWNEVGVGFPEFLRKFKQKNKYNLV